jgi:Tfp pilus assembly protein PilX
MKNLPNVTQKGQALIIILLSMSVVLTVVLSVVSKSVTDISITSYEEDSSRAFSAAEAGIEQSLLKQQAVSDPALEPGVSFDTQLGSPPVGDEYDYPEVLKSGDTATIWFASHDAYGNLTCASKPCTRANRLQVCWSGTGAINNETPAIELSIYYDNTNPVRAVGTPNDYSNVKVMRFTFEPNLSRKSTDNNNFDFKNTGCSFGSGNYKFSTGNINLVTLFNPQPNCVVSGNPQCLLMARIKMLYNNTTAHPLALAISGGNNTLPAQGIEISSTGVAGESTRKVSVLQNYPEPGAVFDNAVFSLNKINKVP